MAHSPLPLLALWCLLSLATSLSLPVASSGSTASLSASSPALDGFNSTLLPTSNATTWYYVSGDGTQIVPIKSPQDRPANMAASNGHSYTFGFGNQHGEPTARPGLAKFLFQCEFNLFGQVPASGQGVWKPYPRGRYACNGELPGMVRLDLSENDVGWKMAYHDIAFVLKVLHDVKGVKDEAPFFDFHVNYTPELEDTPYETVAYGSWARAYGNDGAASTQ